MGYLHSILAALVLFTIVHALLTGEIRAVRRRVTRHDAPFAYWALVGGGFVISGVLFYMAWAAVGIESG
jgi:hypothetical protein